jgi:hypothetical protein
MTRGIFAYLETLINDMGGVTVNMPLTDQTIERFKSRGDKLVHAGQLGDIAYAYMKLYPTSLTGFMPDEFTASNVAWYARGQELNAKGRNELRWKPRSTPSRVSASTRV